MNLFGPNVADFEPLGVLFHGVLIFDLRLEIFTVYLHKTRLFNQIHSSSLCTILPECLTDLADVEFPFKFIDKMKNKRDVLKIINLYRLEKEESQSGFCLRPGDGGYWTGVVCAPDFTTNLPR